MTAVRISAILILLSAVRPVSSPLYTLSQLERGRAAEIFKPRKTMTEPLTLKPCPYCGGKAEVYGRYDGWVVQCRQCPAKMEHLVGIIQSLSAWNTRPEIITAEWLTEQCKKYH